MKLTLLVLNFSIATPGQLQSIDLSKAEILASPDIKSPVRETAIRILAGRG